MQDTRPDPDRILHQIQQQEADAAHVRGRLKIFFGYAAGVGKTYAMLEAAHAALAAGTDVVAGYIEPHTRPDTLALLEGLEQLPPLCVEYKNVTLREFDLDAAIARRPALLLVDELAHTNAEGCRHRKRCQDIEELLALGIDVYTTVNVQHLESLNDIVAAVTGITVRERVPDSVFDNADQVELVDIEPDDLLARLDRGKVYRPLQARRAMDHFFTRENLVALREIALRRTADRVNRRAEKGKDASAGYYTGEHILICLSSSPSNARVIRTAARLSDAFHGRFTALFVEVPGTRELNGESLARLRGNLRLAEQLGARIATVYGEDVAAQIAEYARASGVSKIVIGRSNNRRGILPRPTLVEQLTALAPNVDVYIIPDNLPPYRRHRRAPPERLTPADTFKTLGLLGLSTAVALGFAAIGLSEANVITVFILGVLFVSVCTGSRIYGAAASFFSVLLFNFFFTVPRFTLQFNDPGYAVTFAIMFAASFITSTLTVRAQRQARQSSLKAYRTEVLLETSQKLQQSETQDDIIRQMARQMQRLLGRTICLYLADGKTLGRPTVFPTPDAGTDTAPYITPGEQAVAEWVFRNNKHAGAGTDTLPGAKCLYLAVRSQDTVFAVAGIAMDLGGPLDVYDRNLLLAMPNEFALALERQQAAEARNRLFIQARQEQLRANLLRAVSHDLRTPLTSISGNASILMGGPELLDEKKKQQLYTDIYDDAMWLISLVENLLTVTRIENGTMQLTLEPELIDEVAQEALRHLNRRSAEHTVTLAVPDDLLMAKMDPQLIVQVLINLTDNAIKYTPAGSSIAVSAQRSGETVRVEVADDGPGIPDAAKEKLFEMFYTAQAKRGDGRRGLGLGLSLCRSIVEAHGGQIGVRDNNPHGTVFWFTLPASDTPSAPPQNGPAVMQKCVFSDFA